MEVTSHCNGCDITDSATSTRPDQSECISSQPMATGTLPHHSAEKAPPPVSGTSGDSDITEDSSASSTSDIAQLLPSAIHKQRGVDDSSVSPAPVCTPASSSLTSPPPPPPPQSSTCNRHSCSFHHSHHHHHHHHPSTNQKRLSSTKSSASLKTDAAQIKEVAGDVKATFSKLCLKQDCCVHCVLACLFCEVLSMCSAVGDCLACGVGGIGCCEVNAVGCCCCVEAAGDAACTEDACQAMLDCGIMDECCGSSDCLEICLDCCSICFPS